MARHGTDPDLERVAAELGDALRRQALLNERSSEVVAALLAARSVGPPRRSLPWRPSSRSSRRAACAPWRSPRPPRSTSASCVARSSCAS